MAMEKSHIWIGEFSSKEAFSDYLEETYYEEEREAPLNQFAADQNESFYDYDWVESSFQVDLGLAELIKRHSYGDSFFEAAVERAKDLDIKAANIFIMADSGEFSTPQSKHTEEYRLVYLGEFETSA